MEFDVVEKILLAVMCPVFASSLVVFVYMTQAKWEKRRDQRWWESRKAEWIDCDQKTYAARLRGAK